MSVAVMLFLYDETNPPKDILRELSGLKGITCISMDVKRKCHAKNNSKGIKVDRYPAYVYSVDGVTEVLKTKKEFLEKYKSICPKC